MEQERKVSEQFVKVYFENLFKDPMTLLKLYTEESCITRGEGSDIIYYKGLKEIGQALQFMKPNCLLDIKKVAMQNTFEKSLIVTVTGFAHDTGITRPFTQVFLLHPQEPLKGLFVLNDIFLNTDEEDNSQEVEPIVNDNTNSSKDIVQDEASKVDEEVTEKESESPKEKEIKPNSTKKPEQTKKSKSKKPIKNKKNKSTNENEKEKEKENGKNEPIFEPPTENAIPSKLSWATIAKKAIPTPSAPTPTQQPAIKKATPKKKVEKQNTQQKTQKTNLPTEPSRFLEVRNFDNSEVSDSLKNSFRSFGTVTYVHFLGPTRCLLEFVDAESVSKVLESGQPIKVNGKTVQVSKGTQKVKRGKDSTKRGGNQTRGSNRGNRGKSTPSNR